MKIYEEREMQQASIHCVADFIWNQSLVFAYEMIKYLKCQTSEFLVGAKKDYGSRKQDNQ